MYKTPANSILLLACLGMMIAGCASHGAKESDPNKLPKTQWGSFHGNMRWEIERKHFYNKFQVKSVNDQKLEAVTQTAQIDCYSWECNLHPGRHTIKVDYYWTTAKHRKLQKKQNLEYLAIFLSLGILNGPTSFRTTNRSSPCKIELTFDVKARRQYAISVIHPNQEEPPQAFQIVDIKSEEVITSMVPSCQVF